MKHPVLAPTCVAIVDKLTPREKLAALGIVIEMTEKEVKEKDLVEITFSLRFDENCRDPEHVKTVFKECCWEFDTGPEDEALATSNADLYLRWQERELLRQLSA
jgi:hypothetical protein